MRPKFDSVGQHKDDIAHEEGESSPNISNQEFTHAFNTALVGEHIGEHPGELRILCDQLEFLYPRK